jgi:hypothetical protein
MRGSRILHKNYETEGTGGGGRRTAEVVSPFIGYYDNYYRVGARHLKSTPISETSKLHAKQ